MSSFTYCECPVCEYSVVVATKVLEGGAYRIACPLCDGDNNKLVAMEGRPATDSDRPEGPDARERSMPAFTCNACGRECLSRVSEAQANAEFKALYGVSVDKTKNKPICTDCFNQAMALRAAEGPKP